MDRSLLSQCWEINANFLLTLIFFCRFHPFGVHHIRKTDKRITTNHNIF